MGQLKGPLSGSTGSAWDLTLTTWKSLKVFKGKRKKGQSNPSPAFLAHQSAMSQLVAFGQSLTTVFRRSFKQYDGTTGTWAAWIKENISTAFDYSIPPTAVIDYDTVLVAKGVMAQTELATQVADDSLNTIVVTYPTTVNAGQNATDKLQMVVYNTTQNYKRAFSDIAARSAGTASVPDTTMVAGDGLILYAWFESQIDLTNETSIHYEVIVVS